MLLSANPSAHFLWLETIYYPRNDERWLKAPSAQPAFGLSFLPNVPKSQTFTGYSHVFLFRLGKDIPVFLGKYCDHVQIQSYQPWRSQIHCSACAR